MPPQTELRVLLVDINQGVVRAWRAAFADAPEVQILAGSMLEQEADAWVTPTNARGHMDGGLDAVLKRHFGPGIEKKVQQAILELHNGLMPVGHATCVRTGRKMPRFLISTPTMVRSAEAINETLNVSLACAAAFQAVHQQNRCEPGSITSVALPGLGAGTGTVPVEVCANLMWTGYRLFRDYEFRDFAGLREALQGKLGGQESPAIPGRMRLELPAGNEWTW